MARKANTRKQQRTPQQDKAARDNQRFIRSLYGSRYPALALSTEAAVYASLLRDMEPAR